MTLVESKAAFSARCKVLGIPDGDVVSLATHDLDSFGSFAFIVPLVGGQVDDEALKAALEAALGTAPTVLIMPKYRRIHFESHALVLSDTKSKVDRTESSEPKKLPMPERAQRHEAQVKRLSPGVSIKDWNEPSFSLLDIVQQQLEDAQLRYIPVEQCTCRMQELAGVKRETITSTDKSGFIRIGERDAELQIHCGQDMFRIRQALLRRSLAYDQSGIIKFEVMEIWHNYLFESMQHDTPPGHKQVSLQQVLLADRQIFSRMTEQCRHGLLDTGSGLPAENALTSLQFDPRITTFLLPLPGGSSGGQGGSGVQGLGNPKPKAKAKLTWKDFKEASRQATAPYSGGGNKGKGKGKPKGKGKGKGNYNRPPGLEGTWTLSKGNVICDGYNLGTCTESGNCSKGLHVCCKPQCGEAHPYHQCPKH